MINYYVTYITVLILRVCLSCLSQGLRSEPFNEDLTTIRELSLVALSGLYYFCEFTECYFVFGLYSNISFPPLAVVAAGGWPRETPLADIGLGYCVVSTQRALGSPLAGGWRGVTVPSRVGVVRTTLTLLTSIFLHAPAKVHIHF